jgi:hypothetical protein
MAKIGAAQFARVARAGASPLQRLFAYSDTRLRASDCGHFV